MFLAMTVICAMRQNVSVALEAMVSVSYSSDPGSDNETGIVTCSANDDSTTESEEVSKSRLIIGWLVGWLVD